MKTKTLDHRKPLDQINLFATLPTTSPAPVEAGASLNLPAFFHQRPDTTYRLCKLWGNANERNTEKEWHYVAGWIDCLAEMLSADDIVETGDDLTFLHNLALRRSLMAWEVKP